MRVAFSMGATGEKVQHEEPEPSDDAGERGTGAPQGRLPGVDDAGVDDAGVDDAAAVARPAASPVKPKGAQVGTHLGPSLAAGKRSAKQRQRAAQNDVDPEADEFDPGASHYRVALEGFEGPLDLLLHLCKKHELDILDIPVGFVTEKYLEYLALMTELQIDVASEYLVMAAELTHIKSKMLLPRELVAAADAEESEGALAVEEDPRAELILRLLEYQKYRHAAEAIGGRSMPGRDTFGRGSKEVTPEGLAPFAPVNVFKLFDAFDKILARTNQQALHQVVFERIGITERIVQLTELLSARRRMRFEELFELDEQGVARSRFDLVLTFLALLEMCKMRVARIYQDEALGELVAEMGAKRLEGEVERPRDIGREERAKPPVEDRASAEAEPQAEEPAAAAEELAEEQGPPGEGEPTPDDASPEPEATPALEHDTSA